MTTRVFPLICLCALLGLFTGVARAEGPGLVGNGKFHSYGGSGIAVDQSNGDVFTTGFFGLVEEGERKGEIGVGHSEKFDASGNVLPPPPFAEGLYYGAAVNPTNGRLYMASAFGQIEIYDPNTGELLSSFAVPSFLSEFTLSQIVENSAQIATDSAGNLYVPNVPENKVLEYSEAGVLLATFTGSGTHALKGPTGVAVAPSGDVWVADHGDNRVEELGPTGAFLGEFASEGVKALALDGHGDVLAIVDNEADPCEPIAPPCEHLVEYSSSGAQLTDVGAGYFGSVKLPESNESMVAVDDASGRVYVTDGLKNYVWVFQPPVAPVLGWVTAAEVGSSGARFGALITPGGVRTTYRFEYDTREYGEGEGSHGVSVPFPEGVVGEGFSSRTVWASVGGLAPGTTYHYRVVATSGLGTVVGPDQTFTTVTAAQAACPNEAAREGFSAALPDCRAYELVTPVSKASAEPGSGSEAASDGNRFSYASEDVMPGSPQSAGLESLATRGATGWTSQSALPLQPYTGDRCPFDDSKVTRYSADMTKAIVVVNRLVGGFTTDCRGEAVEVASGEPLNEENLLLRDNETGTYRLIDVTPPGVVPAPPSFVAAAADLSLVVFDERAKLTPEAPTTGGRYEWSNGVVHLLSFALPSGAPVAGGLVSISDDGSDVFFTAEGNLYVRVNDERTVQVDQARGGSGPGGGGSFGAVTADGSQVFFTDEASAGLTSDTVPGSGTNLYSFDIDTGQLSDLTPVAHAEAGLDGIGEEGSYVYFTAKGVLSGSQANQFGETAERGKSNLYLYHGGTITFLISGGGVISANGAFLVTGGYFVSQPSGEVLFAGKYLYSAASNRFVCAFCKPGGEADGSVLFGNIPHFISNNGQVFFTSGEALLPRATNGVNDVYEFDYYSGLHLISSGTSSSADQLFDSSPSGNDVFIETRQNLVRQDNTQQARKIYDVRVAGGFPEPALAQACTTTDACRTAPVPEPSIFGEPASQTFSGAGNLAPQSEVKPTKKKVKPKKKATGKRKVCTRGKHGRARCAGRASGKTKTRRRGGKRS